LQLGLDPHVLSDLQAKHRMPKVMDYDSVVLVVAMTVEVRASDGLPTFGETQMLIGSNFLVTIRRGALAPHTELRSRLEKMPDRLARGSDFVAAELLDLLIDRYNLANDMFEKTIEPMEQTLLLRGLERLKVRRLYQLRRDFHKMHNAISPLGEVCRRLAHIEMAPIDAQARAQFGELSDRVSRVDRLLDNLGDGLTFAFEAGMLIEQAKQTETTRRLAAWAAILAVPTAIAGIYGMNFENMPELKWAYGYHFVVGGMATICGTLYYQFRKAKWL
jgi:magnesium transporter